MSQMFSIIEIETAMRRDVEQLGSKPKFWFEYEGEKWLFKEARENTGEDWAEKIASELASALSLPTHRVELADYEGRRGCAVRSFLKKGQVLVHGNEVLGGFITGYDKEKQRGQSEHTFANIVRVLEAAFVEDRARFKASSWMAGYLVLDALVGNTDRHHENWGMILEPRDGEDGKLDWVGGIAPTFDHASSLGRELLDEARERRLKNQTIEAYIRKARGGIFGSSEDRHGLSPIGVAEMMAEVYPDFYKPWQERVGDLDSVYIESLVARVPDARMSRIGRAFTLAFLSKTRNLIAEAL